MLVVTLNSLQNLGKFIFLTYVESAEIIQFLLISGQHGAGIHTYMKILYTDLRDITFVLKVYINIT